MKMTFFCKVLIFILLPSTTFSQTTDNTELQKMYKEDQSSRMASNINWIELSKNDSIREKRVYELLNSGQVKTGKDYYNGAMIFQHGKDTIASGMAVKMMKKALELDSTVNKWLYAAAVDRDLMRKGKPQIYGTQYVKMGQNAKFERYKIDATQVTDDQRKQYNVETLEQQKIKEREMNLLSITAFYTKTNSIDEALKFIKDETAKGSKSDYNVSETAINNFGYELMNATKIDDALKIFKLNTELYPNSFNTHDSYGECLLKLNRKAEGLKAYKKSMELNPKNENARKILLNGKQ